MAAEVGTATLGARISARRALHVNRWALLAAPPAAFLIVMFAYPIVAMLTRSFTEPSLGLGNYREFLGTGVYVETLVRTVWTAALVTAVCLVIAYPYAYLMAQASPGWTRVMVFLVLVPFWTSLLVRTYAWTVLLQDSGVINSALIKVGLIDGPLPLIRNETGVLIGMSQILLPFMVLPLYANMRRVDPSLMRAASNLGAPFLSSLRRVYFPLTMPGVSAGCVIVFIYALGFYITPELLGGPQSTMLSQLVVLEVSQFFNWGLGAAMAAALLVVTLALLVVFSRFFRVESLYAR